jgi:hypothetical protein
MGRARGKERRGEETARHQLGFGFVMFAALASSGRLRPRWMLRCGCTGAEGLDVLACTYFDIDAFKKYSINIDIYRCMSIYFYKYMYIYLTSMNISERLSRFDFEIHEVGHQERLTIDRDVTSH